MAISKIKTNVRMSNVTDAWIGAYKGQVSDSNRLIQIGNTSEMGRYVLETSTSGIDLVDVTTNTRIHRCAWTS